MENLRVDYCLVLNYCTRQCALLPSTSGVLNLFYLVYPWPNENTIIYRNFLLGPGVSSNMTDFRFCEVQIFLKCCVLKFFQPKTGNLKKKGLRPNFKGFSGPKQVISFWATAIQCNTITFSILIIEVCFSL